MTVRRSMIGLAALCAVIFSALTAANASAATTAYTCKKEAPKPVGERFADADCTQPDENGKYRHESFQTKTTTEVEVETSAPVIVETSQFGVPLVLEGTGMQTLPGSYIENTEGGHVSGIVTLKATGMQVVEPEGLGCKVQEEAVTTSELEFESTGGMAIEFLPTEGEVFSVVHIVGCVLEGTYKVTGSLGLEPNGALLPANAESPNQGLTLNGEAVGFTAEPTLTGRDTIRGDTELTPIAFTTGE